MKNTYQKFLTDEQFQEIERFFPTPRKPRKIPLRQCLEGIFYVLSEGCRWRSMPHEYRTREADRNTIYMNFKRWSESGVWHKILTHLQDKNIAESRIIFFGQHKR
jgi:putative transposase